MLVTGTVVLFRPATVKSVRSTFMSTAEKQVFSAMFQKYINLNILSVLIAKKSKKKLKNSPGR